MACQDIILLVNDQKLPQMASQDNTLVDDKKEMPKMVVNVTKLSPFILLALPKQTRKNKGQQAAQEDDQLRYDLGDSSDRNGLVYSCPEKGGLGVKSTRALKSGQFFLEYAGELITELEGQRRDKIYSQEGKGCFLLYFKHKGEQLAVDATLSRRVARLVNHRKKSPNLKLKVVEFDNQPRVVLVAAREVAALDSMEYDYGDRDTDTVKEVIWLKK